MAAGAPTLTEQYRATADRLIDAALADTEGYRRLMCLCDRIGHRLAGSTGLEKAIAWSAELPRRAGLPRGIAGGDPEQHDLVEHDLGVYFSGGAFDNGQVTGNTLSGNGQANVLLYVGRGVTSQNNQMAGGGNGIVIEAGPGRAPTRLTISGSSITSNRQYGMMIKENNSGALPARVSATPASLARVSARCWIYSC